MVDDSAVESLKSELLHGLKEHRARVDVALVAIEKGHEERTDNYNVPNPFSEGELRRLAQVALHDRDYSWPKCKNPEHECEQVYELLSSKLRKYDPTIVISALRQTNAALHQFTAEGHRDFSKRLTFKDKYHN